jgi:hypothetical protein
MSMEGGKVLNTPSPPPKKKIALIKTASNLFAVTQSAGPSGRLV